MSEFGVLSTESNNIPSTLQERLSEAAFLRDSLPTELEARGAYLEEQLNWRSQFDTWVHRLNSWLDEAKLRLRPSSTGVDFEHVSTELNDHVVLFFERVIESNSSSSKKI